ncbi:hypothetical protein [Streptomyces turgidiscabies]|uniref:hypothetical protein n=1 Tax=Streptomyces turgidiscabies TaxID=85558 RepID=UPI00031F6DE4|nr:hypothetical protein [Streptomyces turgidiscabies]
MTDVNDVNELVPAPVAVRDVRAAGGFLFDENTVIDAGPGTEAAAGWLRGVLGAATGLPHAGMAPGL